MPSTPSQGWQKRVHVLIQEAMDRPNVTPAKVINDLENVLGRDVVTRSMLSTWRRNLKPVQVQLEYLPHLARVLNFRDPESTTDAYDPYYIVRVLGFIDPEPSQDELVDTAYRLQKLQNKLIDAQRRASELARFGGAGEVVQAALRTGRWAAAAWPALEGPSGCVMHVADRIDLRRVDGHPASREDVWGERQLKDALRAAYAVQGKRSPRWPGDGSGASLWSIPRIGGPRGPAVQAAYPGFQSVAFSATTLDSWVHDVASLTSMALGYGLTTTRDLAMEISGNPSPKTRPEERYAVHERFLAHPPQRRVWSHHGPVTDGYPGPFVSRDGRPAPDVFHVRLIESDALLSSAQSRNLSVDPAERHRWFDDRDRARELTQQAGDEKRNIASLEVTTSNSKQGQWKQVLEGVSRVLCLLEERGFLDEAAIKTLTEAQHTAERDEPAVAPQAFRWLKEHNCPLIKT